ncbi:MAG: LEPR-XLL domain-containing protein, partial [Paracoccaceae bacterium]
MGRSLKGLTDLLRGRGPDASDDAHLADGFSRDADLNDVPYSRDEKFNVEALEPRILLSADPISASLAALAEDAEREERQIAPIVQQMDAELEALTAGSQDDAPAEDADAEGPIVDFSAFAASGEEDADAAKSGLADEGAELAPASSTNANEFNDLDVAQASFADVAGVLTLDLTDETEAESIELTISNTDALAGTATVTVSGTTTSGAALVNAGTFDDVGAIIGSQSLATSETILAEDTQNDWILTTINGGTLNGMSFSDIENLTGGSARDSFVTEPTAFVTGEIIHGAGTDELSFGGNISISGDFTFDSGTRVVTLEGGGTASVDFIEVSATSGRLFAGSFEGVFVVDDGGTVADLTDDVLNADAVGFLAEAGAFELSINYDTAALADLWFAVSAEGLSGTLLGVDEITGALSNLDVSFNLPSSGDVIDFATTVTNTAIDFVTSVESISADVNFSVGSEVLIAAAATLTVNDQTVANPDAVGTLSGRLVDLSLSGGNIFAGTGGVFAGGAIDTSAASGFSATGVNVDLSVFITTAAVSYTGLELTTSSVSIHGFPGVTVTAQDLAVSVNTTSGAGGLLDWSGFAAASVDLTPADVTSVAGTLTLDVSGFIIATGSFTLSLTDLPALTLAGQGAAFDADLLQISLSGASLFAGAGAVLDTGGALPAIDTTEAIGFFVANGSLNLALINEDAGPRVYSALSASLDGVGLVGLEDVLEMTLTDAELLFNGASGVGASQIDWTVGGDVPVFEGLTDTVNLQVSGTTSIGIADFISGSASFALTSQEVDADLTGNGVADLTDASLLTLGLSALDLSIGSGDLLIDLSDGSLGIAILAPAVGTPTDTRSFVAVAASIASATLSAPQVNANVTGLSVSINLASGDLNGTDAAPLDWTTAIDTGAGFGAQIDPSGSGDVITLDAAALEVAGTLTALSVGNLLSVTNGAFSVTQTQVDVDFAGDGISVAAGDLDDATLLRVGIDVDAAFLGAGGVGVAVSDGSFALASIATSDASATTDTRSFTAVSASLAGVNFAGLPAGVTLAPSDLFAQLNTASGDLAGAAATSLDWTSQVGTGDAGSFTAEPVVISVPNVADLTVDFTGDLVSFGGTLEFNLFDFAVGTAGFVLTQPRADVSLDDGATRVISNGHLLTIELTL